MSFGEFVGGTAVFDGIGSTPVAFGSGGEKSKPVERVEVKSVAMVAA